MAKKETKSNVIDANLSKEEKKKALEDVLAQIDKAYGAGTIRRFMGGTVDKVYMGHRRNKVIKRERQNMTDTKRVQRTIQGCNEVFNDQHLNFSEGLDVTEKIIVNIFDNKAQEAETLEDLQAVLDIAEEFLTTLTRKVANVIQGK